MRSLFIFQILLVSFIACSPAFAGTQTTSMSGSIDNRFSIDMELKVKDEKIRGSYKYSTSKDSLTLDGTIRSGTLVRMDEKDPKGKVTGSFSGRLIDDKRFVGTWSNPKKTKFMHCIVVSPTVPNALDNGRDGIIITQQTKKIAKPESSQPGATAVISYPVVAQKFLPKTVAEKVQRALSTKNVLNESPDEMIANIKGGDTWLNEVNYTINYNKNSLVDADFIKEGCGAYPDGNTYHVLVDLKSGNQVRAQNAFAKSAIPKLTELIKARMTKEVKEAFQKSSKNLEEETVLKDQIRQPISVPAELLDNFTVSDDGLTFNHDWQFAHVCKSLQPEGRYFFPFSELKTIIDKSGPLGQFIER